MRKIKRCDDEHERSSAKRSHQRRLHSIGHPGTGAYSRSSKELAHCLFQQSMFSLLVHTVARVDDDGLSTGTEVLPVAFVSSQPILCLQACPLIRTSVHSMLNRGPTTALLISSRFTGEKRNKVQTLRGQVLYLLGKLKLNKYVRLKS